MATRRKVISKKKKPSNNLLAKVMGNVDALAKKNNVSIYNLEEFEDMYGVKFFIPTGLPSLDMHLFQEKINNHSGKLPYGIPTGRVTEIVGNEASFKTTFTHEASAACRKMGGLVFLAQTENDFDLNYYRPFYESKGLDFDTEVKPFVRAASVSTVGDLEKATTTFVKEIRAYYKAGGEPVPIVIVVDSIASMFSNADFENYDKDGIEGTITPGSSAKDLHRFFKGILEDVGRYNIAFIMTNHWRAKIGSAGNGPTRLPAHDSAVKYYASTRLETAAGGFSKADSKTTSHFGIKYTKTRDLYVKIRKKRGKILGTSHFNLVVNPNLGFNYIESLVDAMMISNVVKKTTKGFVFMLDPESEYKVEKDLAESIGEQIFSGRAKLMAYLRANMKDLVRSEMLCYKRGPWLLGNDDVDIRSRAQKEVGEEVENV